MKSFTSKILSALSIFAFALLAPASLHAQTNSPAAYDPVVQKATPQEQISSATLQSNNPSFTLAGTASSGIMSSLGTRTGSTKGLQFKDPILSSGLTYQSYRDSSVGGISGNEFGGDIGVDADVYDGYIVGAIYQHIYRGGYNLLGTSEHLDSNGFSLFTAKRYFNLLNVGLAYNFAATEHRLTRAITANLDRTSHGFTMLAGISDRKGKWSWALTPSFSFIHDNYDQQTDLDTGRATITGNLGYDLCKYMTLSGVFNYHNFVIQDTFPNGSIRDDDYWTVGPRLLFYPTKDVTISLDFDSQEGFKNYTAYTVRLGAEVAF